MLESHEALVDYMTPLGLHHIMWGGHHYGPAPWENKFERADWNPVYYHRADARGLGFDRTPKGSNAVSQYHPPVRARFANPATTPEKYLLWFHHVPWDYRMRSGRTLWDELALQLPARGRLGAGRAQGVGRAVRRDRPRAARRGEAET